MCIFCISHKMGVLTFEDVYYPPPHSPFPHAMPCKDFEKMFSSLLNKLSAMN